ncbi:hypothetical protein M501DRAFT_1004266 [Patellaria atrata CBS 101060]|uniref:F-box domain-containing protein n=1 Tax=Patellaria atrata CBS 101060 TaxID=1346257 RepID=A0A9P4SAZ3_9PEZI|nr:hypothetical protein M501DRAFT_1004266 [Patellaria atrata CBS 101060]
MEIFTESPQRSSGATTPLVHQEYSDNESANSLGPSKALDSDGELTAQTSHAEGVIDEYLRDEAVSTPEPQDILSKPLKGKGKEETPVTIKKGPLTLLELPVDILREIITHLTHTNDLTALALTHSAFHQLTLPFIYTRFDIVWPDEKTQEIYPKVGVDALTYGLATLVMAEEIFGEAPWQRSLKSSQRSQYPTITNVRRRRGNHYAQFTKKFSLGNGPPDWVAEYAITKECGKMLGTLVALAVARMRNLETFVWDMPTGVLRDVWLALSSLADREDGHDCKLEKVWIRWHDNRAMDPTVDAPPPPLPMGGITVQQSGTNAMHISVSAPTNHTVPATRAIDRIEHPSFSLLPPLKSLSVLDIDELPYLDEISVLIGRSQKSLKELRVGIARHAQSRDWVTAWEGDGVQQVDYSTEWTATSSIGDKRLGGVLGIIVGRVYNIRQNSGTASNVAPASDTAARQASEKLPASQPNSHPSIQTASGEGAGPSNIPSASGGVLLELPSDSVTQASISGDSVHEIEHGVSSLKVQDGPLGPERTSLRSTSPRRSRAPVKKTETILNGKLHLESLELERIILSVSVLERAFDWSTLANLTILHCQNHEQLWKSLRRTFSPTPSQTRSTAYKLARPEYRLRLKKIHTNQVSPSLISFLKETLAPNSLEILFLQEGRSYSSNVTIDAIFRGPIRRHHASIKKLMIDSSEFDNDGNPTSSSRWRRWMLNREILSYMTSGRMSGLRELAVCLNYKDWHYFLQTLPMIPHIRSLYIPHVADHAYGNNINNDPTELAMQVVDIVTLRRDIEICYMGIGEKCYEILENKIPTTGRHDGSFSSVDGPPNTVQNTYPMHHAIVEDDETEDEDDEDEDDDHGDGIEDSEGANDSESEEEEQESDDDSFYTQEEERRGPPRLRLREILFYDDKVAIFKARHGRL